MADITFKKFQQVLRKAEIRGLTREQVIQEFSKRGHTVEGLTLNQRIGPQIEPLPTKTQIAKDILSTNVPILGSAVRSLRTSIPSKIAEEFGKRGLEKTGAALGTIAATTGEILPQTVGELAIQEIGGRVIAKGAQLGKFLLPSLVEHLTGKPAELAERIIKNPEIILDKEIAAGDILELQTKKLSDAIKKSRRIVSEKLNRVGDIISSREPGKVVKISKVADDFRQSLSKSGFKVPGFKNPDEVSVLSNDTKEILELLKEKSVTFRKAWNIKKKIDNLLNFNPGKLLKVADQEVALLSKARHELNDEFLSVSPRFKKANELAKKVFSDYDDLEQNLFTGKVDTVNRKILNLFRKGTAERQLVEKVERVAGQGVQELENFLNALTAREFSPLFRPGILPAMVGVTTGVETGLRMGLERGVATGLGAGAASLLATSPRIAGLGLADIGKTALDLARRRLLTKAALRTGVGGTREILQR